MIQLIISVQHQNLTIEDVLRIKNLSNYAEDIQINILCQGGHKILEQSSPNSEVLAHIFEPETTEDDMIHSVLKEIDGPSIIVQSNCNFFNVDNLDKLIALGLDGVDVAMFKQKKNSGKIKSWFFKTYQKLSKLFFNFKFFDGNTAMVFYSARAVKIIQETGSELTKIHRWVGINIAYEEKVLPQNTGRKTPSSKIFNVFFWTLFFSFCLFGEIFLGIMGTLNIVSFWVLFGGALVGICMMAVAWLRLICFKHIGGLNFKEKSFQRRLL